MDASGNELKENINCDSVNLDNCEYCVDEISNHCEKMLNNSLHIINPTQGDLGIIFQFHKKKLVIPLPNVLITCPDRILPWINNYICFFPF